MGSRGQIVEIETQVSVHVLSKSSALNYILSLGCLYKPFGDIGMTCKVERPAGLVGGMLHCRISKALEIDTSSRILQ